MTNIVEEIVIVIASQRLISQNMHVLFKYTSKQLSRINPLTPTVVIWVPIAIKHPVSDQVKPSFVIFGIRAL